MPFARPPPPPPLKPSPASSSSNGQAAGLPHPQQQPRPPVAAGVAAPPPPRQAPFAQPAPPARPAFPPPPPLQPQSHAFGQQRPVPGHPPQLPFQPTPMPTQLAHPPHQQPPPPHPTVSLQYAPAPPPPQRIPGQITRPPVLHSTATPYSPVPSTITNSPTTTISPSSTPYTSQYVTTQLPGPPLLPSSMVGAPQSPLSPARSTHSYRPPPPVLSPDSQRAMYGNAAVRNTIQPHQLPRPPLFTSPQNERPPTYYPAAAIHNEPLVLPPPADTRYTVFDDGNASPNLIRPTLYTLPKDRSIWHQTGDYPLALMCTPLAVMSQDQVPRPRVLPDGSLEDWTPTEQIPIVTTPPVRCKHCAAYANPFFRENKCNLCGTSHWEEASGGPALQFGTVEYEVDGPYITRERPAQPVQLYAIDLTCPHLMDYLPILNQLGQDMAQFHWRNGATKPRIGVCFVSSNGIFFHSHADLGRYTVMADVTEEPFAPVPLEDWTFDLGTQEGLEEWNSFVNERLMYDIRSLKDRCRGKNAYGLDGLEVSCGGAALAFLSDALKDSGGRGTLITWRRPNFGVGRLSYREDRVSSTLRQHDDSTPFTPVQALTQFKNEQDQAASQFYNNLANVCVKNRVSLDVLVHTHSQEQIPFLDLATLGEICRVTSGRLMWISNSSWQDPLLQELSRLVQSHVAWDAILKIRCSAGLLIKGFVCPPGVVQEGLVSGMELELSSVSPTTTVTVVIDHRVGGIPKEARFSFFQSALLYTALNGKRRVRVSTLALRVSSHPVAIFKSADAWATAAFLMQESASRLHRAPADGQTSTRQQTRDAFNMECIRLLASFRKANTGMNEQFLLPDTLQLLPLFCMGTLKSRLLRPAMPTRIGGSETITLRPSSDERSFFTWHASTASPTTAFLLVYPRIFGISSLEDGSIGHVHEPEGPEVSRSVQLSPPLTPSIENLADDGIYLVDGGLRIYLVVGPSVPEHARQMIRTQPLSEWNMRASNVLWQLKAYNSTNHGSESDIRPTVVPVIVVYRQERHQAPEDSAILDLMVDDAIGGEKDYVDFFIKFNDSVRQLAQQ